jgi:MFS family permease
VALGIVTGLQFLPVLLFGLYGGVLADRYDKRRLLLGAQAAMAVVALSLAVLDLTGAVALWHVFALAFALGLASAVDVPVRQSFVSSSSGPTTCRTRSASTASPSTPPASSGPPSPAWSSRRRAPAGCSSATR